MLAICTHYSARKICIVSQLATRYKGLVILLQETHCTNTDQLVIPHFTLAGLVSSKRHGQTTFAHEKLNWALTNQSPEGTAIEWLCVDANGCKIVNISKPPTPTAIPVFPISISMLVTLIASTQTGVMILSVKMQNAWLTGQPRATSLSHTILRITPFFSLVVGTLEIIQTWLSRVLALIAWKWTDVF